MTEQEKLWCDLFVKTGSLAEATEQAGYYRIGDDLTPAYFQARGRVIAKMPHIQEQVQNLLRDEALTPNDVIALISKHAKGSLEDYFDITEDGTPKINLNKARQLGTLSNLKKIKYKEDKKEVEGTDGRWTVTTHTQVDLEIYPADMAARTLAQYYDLFSSQMPTEYANQLWIYFVKGLIDLPFLYQELGIDGAHKLLDDIPLPEKDIIDV